MKITIIPSDGFIRIDGRELILSEEEWNFNDQHIHAIQWDGNKGHIEFVTTDPNEEIENIEIIQKYIDAFFEEIPKIEKIRINNEEKHRLEQQNQEQELLEYEREREELRRKIQETAEENARLRTKMAENSVIVSQIITEKENQERKLQIEKELLEIEKARLISEEEINLREKKFEEIFKTENEEILKAREKLIEKEKSIEDKFKSHFDIIEKDKDLLIQEIEHRKDFLKTREEEFEEYKNKSDEMSGLILSKINEESEKLRKEKEIANAKLDLELKEVEKRRHQIQNQYEQSESDIQLLIKKNENILLEIEQNKKNIEESYENKSKQIQLEREENELKARELELREKQISDQEIEFERIKREFQENLEIQKYEQTKDIAVKEIISDEERKELERQGRIQASQTISQLAEITDPIDVFKFVESSPEFDIQTFPVEKIVAWFSLFKKVKDLCAKYNLTVNEVMENEELIGLIKMEGIKDLGL